MQEYKTISVSESTKKQIDHLSKVTGKSKTLLISEIFEELFGIAASLKPPHKCKRINMQIDSSILSQSVTIQFWGRSIIISGFRPVNEEVREKEAQAKAIEVVYPVKKKIELGGKLDE